MDIPESITRVFTKYDSIAQRLFIPIGKPLELGAVGVAMYDFAGIERGLEGVIFIHYKRVPISNEQVEKAYNNFVGG
jgi:hypothetical protein